MALRGQLTMLESQIRNLYWMLYWHEMYVRSDYKWCRL